MAGVCILGGFLCIMTFLVGTRPYHTSIVMSLHRMPRGIVIRKRQSLFPALSTSAIVFVNLRRFVLLPAIIFALSRTSLLRLRIRILRHHILELTPQRFDRTEFIPDLLAKH